MQSVCSEKRLEKKEIERLAGAEGVDKSVAEPVAGSQ
jgi:hypothetical protein